MTDEPNYDEIEEAFQSALDVSLHPRGPEALYDVVAALPVSDAASVLDLGCGGGRQALELARRFGFSVIGVDPVPGSIKYAREELARATSNGVELRVRFDVGEARRVPVDDASIDLIWCRETMVLVTDLPGAFIESRRVLAPGGRMLIHDTFGTDDLQPGDAEALRPLGESFFSMLPDASSAGLPPRLYLDPSELEAAFTSAGFRTEQVIDFRSEWGEYAQEARGEPGRRLVHAARLRRDPDRYVAMFGRANYDVMLADCYWHIFRMLGKLAGRAYVLAAP
jgi:SAM-dependent methyltransferase